MSCVQEAFDQIILIHIHYSVSNNNIHGFLLRDCLLIPWEYILFAWHRELSWSGPVRWPFQNSLLEKYRFCRHSSLKWHSSKSSIEWVRIKMAIRRWILKRNMNFENLSPYCHFSLIQFEVNEKKLKSNRSVRRKVLKLERITKFPLK